ncbi:hypothetical protein AAVH_13001 [Aphelenchoides avenae]|nr:hypothetical protein AAVH_13001 [Aphelenchus avenae]
MTSYRHLIVFGLLAVTALALPDGAAPAQGDADDDDHEHEHGPFADFHSKLDDQQKAQLKSIWSDKSLKKSEMKQKMDEFVNGLPDALKAAAKQAKEGFEKKKAEFAAKASSLGAAAKGVYDQLKAIHEDDTLTREQERAKAKEVLDKADKSALDELRAAGIPLHQGPPGKRAQ